MSEPQPRGICPKCGRDLKLRSDGTMQVHRSATSLSTARKSTCDGSGEEAKRRTQ